MLYFKFLKTTLNYKNEETLYVIFFLYVRFVLKLENETYVSVLFVNIRRLLYIGNYTVIE